MVCGPWPQEADGWIRSGRQSSPSNQCARRRSSPLPRSGAGNAGSVHGPRVVAGSDLGNVSRSWSREASTCAHRGSPAPPQHRACVLVRGSWLGPCAATPYADDARRRPAQPSRYGPERPRRASQQPEGDAPEGPPGAPATGSTPTATGEAPRVLPRCRPTRHPRASQLVAGRPA